MEDKNWTSEAEQKEKRARKLAGIIIGGVSFAFLMFLLLLGAEVWKVIRFAWDSTSENISSQEQLAEEQLAEETENSMDAYLEKRLEDIESEKALTEGLGTGYDAVYLISPESTGFIAKKDGKWGLISETGEPLTAFKFNRFSFMDNTGWVELEKDGVFYVYDDRGTQVAEYTNKLNFRMESEEAYLYRTAKAYMSDMVITTTIPEILEDDYYGVTYYSKKTGKLLYKAVGGTKEVGLFTFPDETGRAVAIQGDGWTNTIYYITAQGCESRVMELPEGVNGRWFYFPGDYTWADICLSNGWLKVYVYDAVPGFLIDEYVGYMAYLNVDTLELVKFPEEYQGLFTIYDMGYGDTVALRVYNEDVEYYQYAICKGDKKLTEEIYYWVAFGETYMTAGQDYGVDILNYDGEVLATYPDVSGYFINGKMLVWDGTGVYFIDETLEACSDYVVQGDIDGCFSGGVIIDDKYYLLEGFAQ